MTVVSVINYKGGVGKTTVTANLAAKLAARGRSVLMIDLDPQASLTFSFIPQDQWKDQYAEACTVKRWFDAFIDAEPAPPLSTLIVTPERVRSHVAAGRCDMICSHLGLINVNNELYAKTMSGHANLRQFQRQFLRVMGHLRGGIQGLGAAYEFVLIDCPPDFSMVTRTALVASDSFLVPATPDFLSTLGIDELRQHIAQLVEEFNQAGPGGGHIAPKLLGIAFTMVQLYGNHPIQAQSQFISAVQRSSVPTFATTLRENRTLYSMAPEAKVPVAVSRPSNGTERAVIAEWDALATEFLRRTGGESGAGNVEVAAARETRPAQGSIKARWGLW